MKWITKNKNHSLFNEWISLFHTTLYKHALWMTGNAEVASDMVQETYYQAWTSMHQLQEKDKALPWLLMIMRRAIYKEQRYNYRNIETMRQLENLNDMENNDNNHLLIDLYFMFEKLSANQRETYLLYTLHGFTYEEISQQLDIPIGTVMSRISRAKETIKAINDSDNKNVVDLKTVRRGEQP